MSYLAVPLQRHVLLRRARRVEADPRLAFRWRGVPAFHPHGHAWEGEPNLDELGPISLGRLIPGAPKPPRELREPRSVVPGVEPPQALLAVRAVLLLQAVLLPGVDAHYPHPSRGLPSAVQILELDSGGARRGLAAFAGTLRGSGGPEGS